MTRALVWLALLPLLGCDALESSVRPGTPVDLAAYERQIFSQRGEDGVIEKIFEIIEPTTRYVAAFGAFDPILHSNTRNLIQQGWSAFLIEGDAERSAKIAAAYATNPKVTTKTAWVYPGNIEILFEEAGVPKDLDLLIIDIDSNDYYVWRAIHDFRPKVVMIELNPHFPPPRLMVIDFHPMNFWDGSYYHGASIQSLANLGKKKGYELIYCMSDGPNAFFVDAQYFELFGIEDNSPTALFQTWPPEGTPFELPDPGKPLLHRRVKIEKKWILDR